MLSLSGLKKDREAMAGLHEIVDVLKGASTARLHGLQAQKRSNEFNEYLEDFFRILNLQYVVHPFLRETVAPPAAIVAITPSESFTGETNSLVIKKALEGFSSERDEMIVLGGRGADLLSGRGIKYTPFEQDLNTEDFLALAKLLVKNLTAKYLALKVRKVDFVYLRFISLTHQEAVRLNILPFHPAKVIKGTEILPEDAIIEPSLYRVADILVRLWMVRRIHEILWETNLAYTAARILQLEGSSQELTRVEGSLRMKYFRMVHSINDKRIREIFTAHLQGGGA